MAKAKLFAPKEYWTFPVRAMEEIAGGCGAGKFGDVLVPDRILGVSITEACRIHDFMYHFGSCLEDKKSADRVFLNNMVRIIEVSGGFWLLRRIRFRLCQAYYTAVKYMGGPAFWKDKNEDATEQLVDIGGGGNSWET